LIEIGIYFLSEIIEIGGSIELTPYISGSIREHQLLPQHSTPYRSWTVRELSFEGRFGYSLNVGVKCTQVSSQTCMKWDSRMSARYLEIVGDVPRLYEKRRIANA